MFAGEGDWRTWLNLCRLIFASASWTRSRAGCLDGARRRAFGLAFRAPSGGRRKAWFDGQLDPDPERLVFIDEVWASTNMARRYGRAPRRERSRACVPHGRRKTTTFVVGLRLEGLAPPRWFSTDR
jgi:hypothetical protein